MLKLQGSLFKMPKVRTFFKIPQIMEQPVLATQDKKKKGIIENAKGGMAQQYIL